MRVRKMLTVSLVFCVQSIEESFFLLLARVLFLLRCNAVEHETYEDRKTPLGLAVIDWQRLTNVAIWSLFVVRPECTRRVHIAEQIRDVPLSRVNHLHNHKACSLGWVQSCLF